MRSVTISEVHIIIMALCIHVCMDAEFCVFFTWVTSRIIPASTCTPVFILETITENHSLG